MQEFLPKSYSEFALYSMTLFKYCMNMFKMKKNILYASIYLSGFFNNIIKHEPIDERLYDIVTKLQNVNLVTKSVGNFIKVMEMDFSCNFYFSVV